MSTLLSLSTLSLSTSFTLLTLTCCRRGRHRRLKVSELSVFWRRTVGPRGRTVRGPTVRFWTPDYWAQLAQQIPRTPSWQCQYLQTIRYSNPSLTHVGAYQHHRVVIFLLGLGSLFLLGLGSLFIIKNCSFLLELLFSTFMLSCIEIPLTMKKIKELLIRADWDRAVSSVLKVSPAEQIH